MLRTILLSLIASLSLAAQGSPRLFAWVRVDHETHTVPDSQFHYWGTEAKIQQTGLAIGTDLVLPNDFGAWVVTAHVRSAFGGGEDSKREIALGGRYAFPARTWQPQLGVEYTWGTGGSIPEEIRLAGGSPNAKNGLWVVGAIQHDLSSTSVRAPFLRVEVAASTQRKDVVLGISVGVRI